MAKKPAKADIKASIETDGDASPLPCAAPDLMAEWARWVRHLGTERRLSPKTLEAYQRDLRQCLVFLADHWGERVTLQRLAATEPTDIRAFLAMRRADSIGSRSLMRALASLRSFARFLESEGKGKVGAFVAIRAPKVGKTLPKPLTISSARQMTDTALRAGEDREAWILTRDAAVLALLYGSGLRISEALGLKRGEVPAPGTGDVITVTGKGNKARMVPVLATVLQSIADYVAACPYNLPDNGPLFVGAKGGPLKSAHHSTGDGAAARCARPAGFSDAACAAALLRHASSGQGRRSARDPGIARPRFALDDADLHRRRYRAPARRLQERTSKGVTRSSW